MANNALNRAAQDMWYRQWKSRHKPDQEPKPGWRARFDQKLIDNQSNNLVGFGPNDEVPPENYGPAYDPNPVVNHPNYNFPPPPPVYSPPPPPPVYSPAGFTTLAPVGVAEGGWGGGAIEHTPGQLISGTPPSLAAAMAVLNNPGLKGSTTPGAPIAPKPMGPMGPISLSGWAQQSPKAALATPIASRRALNPAPQSWSGFGGFSAPAARNPNDLWSAPAGQQSRRPVNAMNQYKGSVNWSKPNAMGEY